MTWGQSARARSWTPARPVRVALLALVAGVTAAAAPAQTPIVSSQLPTWLAPGAPLVVTGFAGPRASIVLVSDGALIARSTSGRLGKFRLVTRAPAPGRHLLTVRTSGKVFRVGTLTTRDLTIAAVGDVTPGEQVAPAVSALGAGYPWGEAGPVLSAADIATANLEGVVSAGGTPVPDKLYHLRGPRAVLDGAAGAGGLDVLTLANNHTGDFGASGLLGTLAAAHAAGLRTVGAGATLAAAHRPVVIEAGGLRIAFLGYSDVNPLGFPATATSPGTARAEGIAEDVRRARLRADVVVCWFHWGIELHAEPNAEQQSLARAALAAGAQIVLGAHPHVFGAVERPGPHTLVAWTLGNFVFPAGPGASGRSGILIVRVNARGVVGFRVVAARAGVRPTL
jgi:poly-gamma-glutamate capsule biosynthesis protein CapA/YwtB (metallophosphatase superfamily)